MGAEKTPAIVLKVVDFSETSCVITLLTEKSGRISGLAKGARRPKGPFFGAIDILSVSNIVFIAKKSGNLDLLTEAKLDRRFRPCRWSLSRLYAGYYLAELLLDTTHPHYPMPEVYRLAIDTLDLLQRHPDQADKDEGNQEPTANEGEDPATGHELNVSSIILWFELRLLYLLGHTPLLDACTDCGRLWNTNGLVPKVEPSRGGSASNSDDSKRADINSQDQSKKKVENGSEKKRTENGSQTYGPSGGLVYFCFHGGGLVCSRCRHGKRDLFSLPRQLVPVLQQFASWDKEEFDQVIDDSKSVLQFAGHRSVRGLLKHYWRSHLGHRLKLEGPMSQIAAKDWADRKKSDETALEKNSET